MSLDLSTWYPEAEAAELLQVSPKTLDRMCKAGKGPERQKRRRAGKKPQWVYNPADVDALRMASGTAIFAPGSPIGTPAIAGRTPDGIPPAMAAVISLVERVATMALRSRQELTGPSGKVWLTIPEASAVSGLSKGFLRSCVKRGTLRSVRDRAVKVRRVDLDNLDALSGVSVSAGGGN